MRIHELRLQNFGRFEDVTIPFPERFSVLVGDNGMGKTSVLDAVARVLKRASPNKSFGTGVLYLNTQEFDDILNRADCRSIVIDGQPKPQFPCVIAMDSELAPETRVSFNEAIYEQDIIEEKDNQLRMQFAALIAANRKGSRNILPLLAYYGTSRIADSHEESTIDWKQEEGFILAYDNCLRPFLHANTFISWIKVYEEEISKFQRPLDIAQYHGFKMAILGMLENVKPHEVWSDFHYSPRYGALIFKGNNFNNQEIELNFKQLSDGYRNVIAMVADMAYRCIQLNPHLGENAVKETPGVVLIDELDLHLHPNWQRNIVADLKRVFPKVQFIATTHSPFIVQSLKAEELIILDENAERGGDPYKRSIEDIAETEMGVDEGPRSERFQEMVEVAEEYFRLIGMGKESKNDVEIADLRAKLNAFEEDFGEDPTFVAMLRLERKAMKL